MARIRTIKPEFWTDEKVVQMSPWARLLFIGIWNFSDDEGRMEFSSVRLKLQILPADDVDIGDLCAELRRLALICTYSHKDKQYLQVINFDKHQRIDKRRTSKYPAPICADLRRLAPNDHDGREGNGKGMEEEKEYFRTEPETAPAQSSKTVFEFPCTGKDKTFKMTDEDLNQLQQLWDTLDVRAQVKRALAWVVANNKKRKTAKGMPRFLNGWFDNAVQKGGSNGKAGGYSGGSDEDPTRVRTGKDYNQLL